jgi:hypothetical protein
MQRWVTTLVGLAVVALTVWLVARTFRPPKAIGHDPHARTYEDDGGGLLYALGDAGIARVDGGSFWGSEFGEFEPRGDGGAGNTMLDGTPVPPLPITAPREIRFGVALVAYVGVQPPTLSGARQATRSKAEARGLADKLRVTAEQDFHAAVQQGDVGSADDVGRIKLGVLEPAPEYVLFTLPVDGVGGPVDTPRGYWIVKRLE